MGLYKEYLPGNENTFEFYILINSRDLPGVMVDTHWHDYYEVLYILSGQAEQLIDNTKEILSQGDIVVIDPGKVHSTVSVTENCYIAVVLFMPESFRDGIKQLEGGFLKKPFQYEKEIKDLFDRMYREFTEKQERYQSIVRGCVYEILGYLGRDSRMQSEFNINDRIVDICKYIDENIDKSLTLKDVADKAGYSDKYFSKYFKNLTGQSFKKYIDNQKMLMAKRLIIFEGLSINETSEKLGYKDTSTFCRAFKRLHSYSPSSLISRK